MHSAKSFALVAAGGRIEFWEYDRELLLVLNANARPQATASELELLAQARQPGMREAWQRAYWGAEGIAQGDQFYLELTGTQAGAHATRGMLADAPALVRALIGDLETMGRQLPASPRPAAYLRGTPVEAQRERYLEERGRKFSRIQDAPAVLRPALEASARRPGAFIPLSDAQAAAFGGDSGTTTPWELLRSGDAAVQVVRYAAASPGTVGGK